jgi:meso-butanediol dehydrogenase/(S,S)-butanediol dehydrogenase/diacetyl reductase
MGIVHTTKALYSLLATSSAGAIVNVASQAALVSLPRQTAYSASKGAVTALTRALAIDWASDGIRVNAVCPGFTATPMAMDQMTPELDAAVSRRVPLGRIFQPAEIANAIGFLASNRASAITGVILPVDGGWTAGEPALPM